MVLEQQQEVQEKEFALCLNMIVKNESHIIKDKLTKLLQKIKFDYWVVSDTGSTDKTIELITDFFKEVGIPGEIYEDDWVDFSHNRNKALEYAFGKSKYLLVFDADDEICGDFVLPELTRDSYSLQFGSYTRPQIVNNHKRWKYVGVLHEYICSNDSRINDASTEIIKGPYHVISGRTGNRNLDSNKYLKDAIILEKAYNDAVIAKDDMHIRYGFYCANSYYDCGKYESAISWYKKTLENGGWAQEKYVSCLKLYNCYNNLDNKEAGFFYLVKSAEYDRERAECYYELIKYYSCSGLHDIAYGYYGVLRDFYKNSYLNNDLNNKLFVDTSISEFHLPYYVVIVCEKMRDYETGIHMYRILFTKKCKIFDTWLVGNMLYNLQFFTEHVKEEDKTAFYLLFQEYVDFLFANNYPISDDKHEFMKIYEKYCIIVPSRRFESVSKEDCSRSKKILFYSGFAPFAWNYTYSTQHALGGSETALANLSKLFPSDFEIYVAGNVLEEKIENNDNSHSNVTYVNIQNISNLVKTNAFHTVIISRYVGFYDMFPETAYYQSFIWGHDVVLLSSGSNMDVESILSKWSDKITGCICQTEWHKKLFATNYPMLKDKMFVINNGIILDKFINKPVKIPNRFIYTSCSERGLERLLKLWPKIIEKMPDAELYISSYNQFPSNEFEFRLRDVIDKHEGVKHLGSLNKTQLYEMMASAEYWLYPTSFSETSCITAMEMLMSEVICIYYPLAGLNNTLGKYGIQIIPGTEIKSIMNLSEERKAEMKINGKKYAMSCSWENRAKEWAGVLGLGLNSHSQDKYKEENNVTNMMKMSGLNPIYPVYIVNLKRRRDRRDNMERQLQISGIDSYEFFEAINGKDLSPSSELFALFERNDFNYKKGVIGCALSHIHLWNKLINDKENDFYIILEDDITFCDNFKKYLGDVCKLFVEQKLEHLALGEYNTSKGFPTDKFKIEVYSKDLYKEWNTFFAYIISKDAAKKAINYINSCSIKCGIDNPQAFGYILKYSSLNAKLVHCEIVNEFGSDIQNHSIDNNFIVIPSKNKEILTVSFCDWWNSEYCGGCFDLNNNFFTNLLREYGNNYEIKIINPSENPDILFYSIFGFSHKNYTAGRKIFFSGEPYPQRDDADFNVTFDETSFNNTRVPLWLCYFDKSILEECNKRQSNQNVIPNREKFCSFIASGPGLANNRKEFIEKLSKYKQVDCGGSYLNNIGYNIPLGLNCSGKIEHNNNYKFAMAFESTLYPGYVTEKICDVFKSNCIPIYWGHSDVVKDFNPSTFINANDFLNFDELIDYIIKVDTNEELYKSFFKQQIMSQEWLDILNDPNKIFFKNLADKIIGKNENLIDKFEKTASIKSVKIINIWHNKLFDNCYKDLDEYSLSKIVMYDVNPSYQKIYNIDKSYKILKEYELKDYNNLLQATNYCQTSCLYHVYSNKLFQREHYIGFIQYDMELEANFINDIEAKINETQNDIFFFSLIVGSKVEVTRICNPYNNSILEKYNNYFNTNHTYESIINHKRAKYFICLHTFVIPTITYMKMMSWYCSISDWLHVNYINGIYIESISEVTEELFGLFLLLQIIENDNIQVEELKLKHNWPNLHNETSFNNYKDHSYYFSLSSIINNNLTDKNSYHSYVDVYENLFKNRQLSVKNVLEIGIERGGSLKLWNDYFVNATIYGLDINDAPKFLSKYKRIITQNRDAYSNDTLQHFLDKNIKFDVIIDDGPHTLDSMIFVIENYTKLLNKDGILIIEDVQNVDWCDNLYNFVPSHLKDFSYKIDRRHIKGTLDDILFIVENKYVIEENLHSENKDLWIFYVFEGHNYKVIEDYINSLKEMYKIVYTQDIEYVLNCNPKKISYIMNIVDDRILNKFKNTDVELSFLNTEPLSISYNLDLLKCHINKYPYLKIYDYSFSNLQIILHNNLYGELLEYQIYEKENMLLKDLLINEPKIYDFGIITYGKMETNTVDNSLFHKKKNIVNELISKGFKIHIISGWGLERDKELAKCKVILNIHSILGINGQMYYSKTFENIRCNRLLDAGFKILSEDSINCNKLVKKYGENLKFINYENFKNIEYSEDFWDKINNKNKIKKYCFIHSCNIENVGTYRLDYLVNSLIETGCINIFDKIYINNTGLPIDNKYGENFEVINCSENTQLFETPTINLIKDFSQKNPNCYILYLHTKGISYSNNDVKVNDWINYMLYFLVKQHKNCISVLDNNYDTVGCNYSNDLDKECFKYTKPFPPPHYNGNFWWANANYLCHLPNLSIEQIERNAPKFWLFKNNPCFFNLHSSNVNHYQLSYSANSYINKL